MSRYTRNRMQAIRRSRKLESRVLRHHSSPSPSQLRCSRIPGKSSGMGNFGFILGICTDVDGVAFTRCVLRALPKQFLWAEVQHTRREETFLVYPASRQEREKVGRTPRVEGQVVYLLAREDVV